MAFWDKITSRGNVEDRRGFGPAVGGVGVTGIALLFLVNYLLGGNPMDVLNQLSTLQPDTPAVNSKEYEGVDSYEKFASTVLGSNNDMWQVKFSENKKSYTPPKLVLFRQATNSSCGQATSQVGPHYCPLDETIYLDETFFDELTKRFGAKGGDVAQAYVISHEVGHHAQNLFGTLDKAKSNEDSIKVELQADCYAGLWGNSIKDTGVLEKNEFDEAIDAAGAVGDDRIQEKVTGYINPESWTHGSSAQRKMWLSRGYESGKLSSCDTFN